MNVRIEPDHPRNLGSNMRLFDLNRILMKKLSLSVVFVSLLFAGVFTVRAQETPGQDDHATEQELMALSAQWMDAVVRKDHAALDRFLAPNYYYSKPGDLEITDRSTWLKNAMIMDWRYLHYRDFKVDLYGETAVVSAMVESKLGMWGIPVSSDVQVTDVWVKRNGQWQVAARHLGASSIVGQVRVVIGFAAGLALCFLAWLFFRSRRRKFAANRKLSVT
jgi:hypothetical protein